ncbi:MAG: hypothetical protein ACLUKN_16130 [Bacilli bacterium]
MSKADNKSYLTSAILALAYIPMGSGKVYAGRPNRGTSKAFLDMSRH